MISAMPLKGMVAATSVGIVHSQMMLDLCYDEDCSATVDFNVVMTGEGKFAEIQGTAETTPFSRESVDSLLSLAEKGIMQLFQIQKAAIETIKIK